MTSLFDPLNEIHALGGMLALLPDGRVDLAFGPGVNMMRRRQCGQLQVRYYALLRLQLSVPAGERPRTVQQLVAAGKVRLRQGRYVIAK